MIIDQNMTYNFEKHRYVLTADYVAQNLNINLDEALSTSGFVGDMANEVEKLLNRVSLIVYQHIYNYSAFARKTERMLALEDGYRTALMEAMGEQLEYMLNNGDLTQYGGANMESMSAMDSRIIKKASFSSMAHDILVNADIIKCAYYFGQKDIVPRYEEEGY